MKTNIWFALIQVEPVNNNRDLGKAKGAFVNVAYKAESKDAFVQKVSDSFKEYDFTVLGFDEIERLPEVTIENIDDSEKILLLKRIEKGAELAWGDFHTYMM